MRKIITKAGVLFSLLLAVSLTVPAYAKDLKDLERFRMPDIEENKQGSLSVIVKTQDQEGYDIPLQGVTIQVDEVARLHVQGGMAEYILTEDYKDVEVDFEGMTASESNEAAKEMERIADAGALAAYATVTDQAGQVEFKDLEPGMYLVRQRKEDVSGSEYLRMEPFLISVPQAKLAEATGKDNAWEYSVQCYPKCEIAAKPYVDGMLTIEKRVLDGKKKELKSKEKFYVGLFEDEELTTLIGAGTEAVVEINMNGQSAAKKQTLIPFRFDLQKVVYIAETDKNGVPVRDSKSFEYRPEYSANKVTFDADHASYHVVIKNYKKEDNTAKKNVRTGDLSMIGLYVVLMGAALLVIMRNRYRKC